MNKKIDSGRRSRDKSRRVYYISTGKAKLGVCTLPKHKRPLVYIERDGCVRVIGSLSNIGMLNYWNSFFREIGNIRTGK
jgi:hypothetical protein